MNEGNNNKKGDLQPMAQSALKKDEVYIKELDKEKFYESGFPKQMNRKKFGLPISDRLKIAREKHAKLSLSQVEKELGKVENLGIKAIRSTIQGYEAPETNANHRYPSLYVFYNLCKIYNVNVNYLMGFSDNINVPSEDIKELLEETEHLTFNGVELRQDEKESIYQYAKKLMELRKL